MTGWKFIKSITIKNVKGIKCKTFEFKQNFLYPNRPNIFVAPNGFGKSSISAAFKSLTKMGMRLQKNEYRNADSNNSPFLSIVLSDGKKNEKLLFADIDTNIIDDVFDIEVINSPLKAKKRSLGGASTIAVIDVEPVIIRKLPELSFWQYSLSKYKQTLNGDIDAFKDLEDLFSNPFFICEVREQVDYKKINQVRKQKIIANFKKELLGINFNQSNNTAYNKLIKIDEIIQTKEIIKKYDAKYSDNDAYIQALQVLEIFNLISPNDLSILYKNCQYEIVKNKFKQQISVFDNLWLKLNIQENKGKFYAELPNPSLISNGQRDILSFISKLIKFELKTTSKQNKILIIDEIFDYLDEANLVAAQYYLCKFIDVARVSNKNLYVIIMTHLDPKLISSYCFNNHKMHLYYLNNEKASPTNRDLEKLLINRDIKDNLTQNESDKIAKYFLHFHPNKNYDLTRLTNKLNIVSSLLHKSDFIKYIEKQFEYYKKGNIKYDPLAVCCYVRIVIEKKIYEKLDKASKKEFLNIHKTNDRLNFAVAKNIYVPELYYLLSLIYNEALHCKQNYDNYTRLYSKLDNQIIKNMILEI